MILTMLKCSLIIDVLTIMKSVRNYYELNKMTVQTFDLIVNKSAKCVGSHTFLDANKLRLVC